MDADVWRQAKGVLAEALLIPPNERDALVVERCTDPLLRREVQAYLHQYDEDFLESVLTVSETIDNATPSEGQAAPDVHPGEHIGPYVVLERLGVGGMGHVFLGNDTRLHRKVALKCLIASASADDLRSRILHEARAAARVNHPNIAAVHDVVDHGGRPFLVMEYVEGENLAAVLRRERPPIERILAIGRQLASALTAAHGKGIIHRDLKPANIQVMPDGSVKILDFGVAQAMSMLVAETAPRGTTSTTPSDDLPLSTRASLQGDRGGRMHPGTPAYMSPEQMFGRPIDQRSDLYSLGVIMYEMATGHRPYSAEDPLDVVLALSRSLLRPTGAETNLPPQVNEVIGKLLAVKVEERYQTAAELESALILLIGPDPTLAAHVRPATMWTRTRSAARYAMVVLSIPACIVALGFMQTRAFNITLGRIPPFDQESPLVSMELGLRSLLTPTLYLIAILIAVSAARFIVRVLSLSQHIDHLLTTGVTRTTRLVSRLGLDDPLVLGQAVAGIGIVLLTAVMWRYYPLIRAALSSSIDTKPAEQFLPLQAVSQSRIDYQWYQFFLSVLIFGFGAAIVRLQRLRASRPIRRGGSALALVIAMFTLAIVMCQWPYRIEYKSQGSRLDMAGERCYKIGEWADEWLIYCPDSAAPHNRRVKRTNPALHDLGKVESIFTPRETSPK